MKKKKYLPLYFKWLENGRRLPEIGLCYSFARAGIPYETLNNEFFIDGEGVYFWEKNIDRHFNDTRQNIVLLMAAMNGEL